MSRLEELIAELCPDGVEYKRFDEACMLHARIGWQRLTRAEYMNSGNYLLITGTNFTESHEINYESCVYVSEDRYIQDKNIQIKNGDILITKDGTLGKVAQVQNLSMPATLNGGVFVVGCKDDSLENRFIMHYLLSGHFQSVVEQQKTGSTISHLTQTLFSRLLIPVPPLPVQREVVRILDNFTELTSKLTAELTAELTARKKQYEYYRDQLLTFGEDVPTIKLGTLCEIGDGLHGTPSYDDNGDYYFVNGNNMSGGKVTFNAKTKRVGKDEYCKHGIEFNNTVFMSINGTIGNMAFYNGEKIVLGKSAAYFNIVTKCLDRDYLYYYLQSGYARLYYETSLTGSTIKNLGLKALREFEIPLPTIHIQKTLAEKVTNFCALCNDITTGLPAEIDARQKQYEYYRDKLLTFKEKKEECELKATI